MNVNEAQVSNECEEQAREDIYAAFAEWAKRYPLSWTADEMTEYWTEEPQYDKQKGLIRARPEYRKAIEKLLPELLAAKKAEYEQKAALYWIVRRALPGSSKFDYKVCDTREEAETALDEYKARDKSEAQIQAVQQYEVLRGDCCLWDTWLDGRLIYQDLWEQI